MKTNVCLKNFYSSSSKNWISALKHSGIRFSNVSGNTYGDLYHYAGNNPVRYIDPDGRVGKDYREPTFVNEVLGKKGLDVYTSSIYVMLPSEFRSASWDILGGLVFLSSDIFYNPMASSDGRNTLIHELYHQIQYSEDKYCLKICLKNKTDIPLPCNLTIKWNEGAFSKLIGEFNLNKEMEKNGIKNYTYNYGNLSKINKLSDLVFLESQAQLVGDFAQYYYDHRYSGDTSFNKTDLKRMAEILKNSGYDTEAVRWVLENY